MAKKYIVVKPFGDNKAGDILEDSRVVRRKLQEGGTVEELTDDLLKKKKADKEKKAAEFKKMQKPVKNKMEPDDTKNKGDK